MATIDRIKAIRNKTTSSSSTSNTLAKIQNIRANAMPTFKTLEEAQAYANANNINAVNTGAKLPTLVQDTNKIQAPSATEVLRDNYGKQLGENIKSNFLAGAASMYDYGNALKNKIKLGLDVNNAIARSGALFSEEGAKQAITDWQKAEEQYNQNALEDLAKTQPVRDYQAEVQRGNENYSGLAKGILEGTGTVSNMIPALPFNSLGILANAGGNAYNKAIQEGATPEEALRYGTTSGATEVGIEALSGGALNKLADIPGIANIAKYTDNIANPILRGGANLVGDVVGEGAEEIIATVVDPLVARITYNPEAPIASMQEVWNSFTSSIIPTLMFGGINAGSTYIQNSVNQVANKQKAEIEKAQIPQEQKEILKKQVDEMAKVAEEEISAQTQKNILPESAQMQETTAINEIIPQEGANQETANVVQNTANAQNINEFNGYTEKEIKNFEGGKIKVAREKSDILNFVKNAQKAANNLKLYMSKVAKSTADIIKQKFNIDVNGYNISLKNDDVRKIYKDHGKEETETPRGQVPITEEDFTLIPSIINEPDNIELVGTSQQGKPAIRFEKNIEGNTVVITYVSDKHRNLELQTMYKFKNGKKIDSSTALYEKTPRLNTSEMDSSTNLINNIIQPAEDSVNRVNLKKPKLEELAQLTAENAQLPKGSYKQKADKMTAYRRKFWDNVESSKIIGQNIKDQVNMTNYERKTNDDTLNKMKERLDTDPVRLTQEWWAKDIKKATDQDIALGAILLERYQQEGRFDEAVDVVQKLADIGTEAGRTVQMYSIFQRLTPEGMQIYQQKKLNGALENITKKQTGKWVEQNKDKFKLTEDDATFITAKVQEAQNAPTERQKQIALAEIEKHINDKLPPEAGQSIKAFRRIAMLFNPKTQVRNVVGNTTVMPLNYVTDLVATGIDKAIAKKTGVRTTTLPSAKTMVQGAKKGLTETWDDYRRGIRTTPTGTKYEIQNNVKSFNENTGNKVKDAVNRKLNGIDRILSSVMEAGDRPFYEAAYQNSLQGQMKANGVTEPTQDMIDIASNVALSQTWQDSNNYTQAVLGIRSAFNKINIRGFGLGDLIIPFAKTPANLTKAMVEYSPAGLIPTIINYNDMRKAISRGDMTPMQQKKFVTSVGKAAAGTLLYVIANSLVQSGTITGSSNEDKDVANFEKNVLGIQPYSIKIGDKTYTYNWAQPLAAPLAIMADAHKMSEEGAELNDILLNALKVGGDQLVANSFLQGIQELLSSQYSNESMMDNLVGAIMDLPTQFTPTLLGQIATYTDATKRQTYENGDAVGTMVNEVKNKIPGMKETLAPQVNTFGEEILNYGGDNTAFNVFFNPGNISSANATDTQKELYALYEATQDTTIFPRQAPYSVSGGGEKVALSSKERAEYQKTSGAYVSEHLDALFDSKFYETLEDEQKAEIVNKIVSDADTTAKSKWVETNTTAQLAEKQEKLENAGISLVDYYNSWAAQKDIEGIPGPDGKTLSGSKSRLKKEAIDKATEDLDKYQRRVLYEMFNVGESVW